MLDPQGEYDTIGYSVLLTMDRTLVGYPPSSNFNTATSVVDDAASNYTVSNGGKTYTFTLRSGLRWAVTDPSTGQPVAPDDGTPVTSQDFELGLERECDPSLSAYGNPSYYTSTIAGLRHLLQRLRGAARHRHAGAAGRLHLRQPDLGHLDPGQPDPGHQPDQPGGRLPQHHVHVLRGRRAPVFADPHAAHRGQRDLV